MEHRIENLKAFLENKNRFLPTDMRDKYIKILMTEFTPILLRGNFPETSDQTIIGVWTGYRGECNFGRGDCETKQNSFLEILPHLIKH